jgi:hypothetical protein
VRQFFRLDRDVLLFPGFVPSLGQIGLSIGETSPLHSKTLNERYGLLATVDTGYFRFR